MTPLHDRSASLAAWLHDTYIFDTELNWVAFIVDGHAWSSASPIVWLGPVSDGMSLAIRIRADLTIRGG